MSITPSDRLLIASIESQSLALLVAGRIVKEFPISTSKKPPSCLANSYGTPTGLHQIERKIGEGAPSGMVFKGRVATGKCFRQYPKEARAANLITSRIMRLRGLERGKNAGDGCDSYDRYIYIHGTNHENRIGEPFSGGCIEMFNKDVINLFDLLDVGDLIWITND